jgi:hypothetical protein
VANVNVTRNPPNSEIYSHIPIAEIVKLHNLGYSHRKIGKLRGMGPAAVGNRLRKEGILGTFPKVTEAQLKEALNDPAWQARQGVIDPAVPTNRVVCLECRELKCELNANGNHSHLAGKHHMPAAEYKRNHPGARLVSFKRSAAQNTRQGRTKTIQDLIAEDAEAYVTPEVWKAVARDEEWEEHKGIMKFVVCRMRSPQGYRCGFKSKSDLHLHLKAWHGLTSAAYRELFPKALQLPLGAYPAKNKIAKTYADRRRKEISELQASDKRASELEAYLKETQAQLKEEKVKRDHLRRRAKPDNQKQKTVMGSQVEACLPRLKLLFAHPQIVPDPRRRLVNGWANPDFSESEKAAARNAAIGRTLTKDLPLAAARWLVAIQNGLTFDAVKVQHNKYRKGL